MTEALLALAASAGVAAGALAAGALAAAEVRHLFSSYALARRTDAYACASLSLLPVTDWAARNATLH